jgi:hypothetical protein
VPRNSNPARAAPAAPSPSAASGCGFRGSVPCSRAYAALAAGSIGTAPRVAEPLRRRGPRPRARLRPLQDRSQDAPQDRVGTATHPPRLRR